MLCGILIVLQINNWNEPQSPLDMESTMRPMVSQFPVGVLAIGNLDHVHNELPILNRIQDSESALPDSVMFPTR